MDNFYLYDHRPEKTWEVWAIVKPQTACFPWTAICSSLGKTIKPP